MKKDNVEYKARGKNGAELSIKHDGFHYRATAADGKPAGDAFMVLDTLLGHLGAEIVGEQNGGAELHQDGPAGEAATGGAEIHTDKESDKEELEKLEKQIAEEEAAKKAALDKKAAEDKAAEDKKKETGGRDKSVRSVKK